MSATIREFSAEYDIIIVDGCVYCDNVHLQICFMEGKPSVLKHVYYNEYVRAEALVLAGVAHPNLVKLRPIRTKSKMFVVMPLLPVTVARLWCIPVRKANELWDEVGAALECLHSHGFAHKDVKPDDVCVDGDGRFVLEVTYCVVRLRPKTADCTKCSCVSA